VEDEMNAKEVLNHNLSILGWGALFVWWGIAVMINPITLGMTAMGTGLIMLVINAVRALKGIEPVASTTDIGITILAWGVLDQARLMSGLPGGVSFALVLVVIGLNIWLTPFLHRSKPEHEYETV
jgi:hypothetical protein